MDNPGPTASKSFGRRSDFFLFACTHLLDFGKLLRKLGSSWVTGHQHGGLESTLEVHSWSVPYGLVLGVASAAATLSVRVERRARESRAQRRHRHWRSSHPFSFLAYLFTL